jgi:hypothetical protein
MIDYRRLHIETFNIDIDLRELKYNYVKICENNT